MHHLISLWLALVLLPPVCRAEPVSETLSEQIIREQLLGTWCMKYADSPACQSHERYWPDGLFRACMRSDDGRTLSHLVATYTVNGNRVCLKVTESTDAVIPVGDHFCVTVLHLDRNAYRYILDLDKGTGEMRRLPDSSAECPDGATRHLQTVGRLPLPAAGLQRQGS